MSCPGWLYLRYGKVRSGYYWHALRRHSCCWFACGNWVTSMECYTCNHRWEEES